MEQHPVPQNISSYQFHLVGDMTLKQFLELATGVVIGVIIYATSLPGLIKWPLILFSAASGAALAFVPFEERPLERWIIAFFRSVYSPTLFHWGQQTGIKYFQDESVGANASLTPALKEKSNTFSRIPFLSKLEESENAYLSKITQLFAPQQTGYQPATVNTTQQVQQPQVQQVTQPVNSNGGILTTHTSNPLPLHIPTTEAKKDIEIPRTTLISVNSQGAKQDRPHIFVEETQTPVNLETTKVSQTLTPQTVAPINTNLQQVQFSTQAAPPSLPTIVNTVSGQVMDGSGNVVEGAILEIRDTEGRPVRALKTNKAGHFLIVTALTNGKYNLHTEKEGLNFEPLEFEATGNIIMPIAIKAMP